LLHRQYSLLQVHGLLLQAYQQLKYSWSLVAAVVDKLLQVAAAQAVLFGKKTYL
jgi:pantothenate synthetase